MNTNKLIFLQFNFLSDLELYHQLLLLVDFILILLLFWYIYKRMMKKMITRKIHLIALPEEKFSEGIAFDLKLKNFSNIKLFNAYIHILIQEKHNKIIFHPINEATPSLASEELPFQGLLPWTNNPYHKTNPFINIPNQSSRIQKFIIYHPQKQLLELHSERGVKNYRVANTQTIFLRATEEYIFTVFVNADNIPQKEFKFIWDPINFKLRSIS
ncbi:MAG: hypothetical protein Q8K70_12100 [Bacteroidota bacterium]|nr:hypothetical protein [Bacteroidota bacterium]